MIQINFSYNERKELCDFYNYLEKHNIECTPFGNDTIKEKYYIHIINNDDITRLASYCINDNNSSHLGRIINGMLFQLNNTIKSGSV